MILYIILLCGLGTLGYFGADMYLPALPELETDFTSTKTAVGLTFSMYMVGITMGQLIYGSLSDRWGRKKTLILGLSLFVLASIGCIYSEHIVTFIFWRILQALGACAAMVIWQAIVIDKYDRKTSHHIFAIVFPMLAISPALAPTIGGVILILFSWHTIFALLALIALSLLFCVIFFFRETTTFESRENSQIKFHDIKKKYLTLLRSKIYMGYVCTLAMTSSAYFCYLTASPFILNQMGYSTLFIGLSYIPQTVAFMCGGFISKKLMDWGGEKILTYCLIAFVVFSFILLGTTVLLPLKYAFQIIAPFTIMALLNGVLYPTGMSIALNHFPELAGTAAGLAGSIQAFIAFISTSILATLLFLGVISMSVFIVILAITGLTYFLANVRVP